MRAHGSVTQAALDALKTGTEIAGVRYGPIEAVLDKAQGSNVWLSLALRRAESAPLASCKGGKARLPRHFTFRSKHREHRRFPAWKIHFSLRFIQSRHRDGESLFELSPRC